jgi:hypothetical protein
MTAAQYRERHGLQRTAGLITAELRTRIQDNAKAHMASPAGQAFIEARDRQRAQAARLAQPLPWRTATQATNRAARVGKGRRGTEVTCANPRLRGGFLSFDEREAPSVLQPQLGMLTGLRVARCWPGAGLYVS